MCQEEMFNSDIDSKIKVAIYIYISLSTGSFHIMYMQWINQNDLFLLGEYFCWCLEIRIRLYNCYVSGRNTHDNWKVTEISYICHYDAATWK